MPFTTLPFFTSRQGIILFAYIYLPSAISAKFFKIRKPTSPLFSGWNCVANTLPLSIAASIFTPYSVCAATMLCRRVQIIGVNKIKIGVAFNAFKQPAAF